MLETASHHLYIQLEILISFFLIILSCDICFYFIFFLNFIQPFCKRHYPAIVITKTRHVLFTGTCRCLYILLPFIEIIESWPLCVVWTRGNAYLLTRLYRIKTFGGAAVAEWLSSWLAEQEDRGSIPGLATWIFRDWLSPASKSRYGWKIDKSTFILKTTNQPTKRLDNDIETKSISKSTKKCHISVSNPHA